MRSRTIFVALALITVAIGLAVHRGESLPPAARDMTGDAMWAMMVAWWMGAIAPSAPVARRGASALAFAFAIEFSQMYHASWIDAFRRNPLVHLVLGSDFDARDLLAYSGGVLAAVVVEFALRRRAPQLFGRAGTADPSRPRP